MAEGPHSLGKLIEWKRIIFGEVKCHCLHVPTRWGN